MEPNVNINLDNCEWITCECGSHMFDSKIMFKKISAILAPDGQERIVPIDTVVCKECGNVPSFFHENSYQVPDYLKAKEKLTL
jgi:hypothetical protein